MRRKLLVYMLALIFGTVLAQSCNTTKKGCGCGNDLNKVHRAKRVF